jgi:hypothetical protein
MLSLCQAQRYLGSKNNGVVASSMDPSSYANIDFIQTRHLDLNVTVDMDNRVVSGYINLTMQAI